MNAPRPTTKSLVRNLALRAGVPYQIKVEVPFGAKRAQVSIVPGPLGKDAEGEIRVDAFSPSARWTVRGPAMALDCGPLVRSVAHGEVVLVLLTSVDIVVRQITLTYLPSVPSWRSELAYA